MRALAIGLVVCGASAHAAQAPTSEQELLTWLDDGDRDEARLAALRCLSTVSDGRLLRDWSAKGGWRRHAALLTVLAARGSASADVLVRDCSSEHWPVRAAAVRAAASIPATPKLTSALEVCARDRWAPVRVAALVSLFRIGALTPAVLAPAFDDPATEETAVAILAAAPKSFSSLIERGISHPRLGLEVLWRLAGVDVGAGRKALRRAAGDSSLSVGRRCFALLVLPRADWPQEVPSLVLSGLAAGGASAEAVARVGSLLTREQCAVFLERLWEERDPERVRARLRVGRRAPRGAGVALLAKLTTFPLELRDDVLALLVHQRQLGLEDRAVQALRDGGEAALPWLRQAGRQLAASEAGRAALHAALTRGEPLASLAYGALIAAKQIERPLLDYVASDATAGRAGRLLSVIDHTPAAFWLPLLAHANTQMRWLAAKGLAGKTGAVGVLPGLLAALYREKARSTRSALLSSVLIGIDAAAVGGVASWVHSTRDDTLTRTLIEHLERSPHAWADDALRSLESSRLADRVRVALAVRGDRQVCRAVLDRPAAFAAPALRRMRSALARFLDPREAARQVKLLTRARGDAATPPWVRLEIVAWLRRRPDLDVTEALTRVYGSETDVEVRENVAAALVERGRTGHLAGALAVWSAGDTDQEGLLLEAVAALPPRLTDSHTRFLVRLLVRPLLHDPLAMLRDELSSVFWKTRVDATYPLLRPVVQALARSEPARFKHWLGVEVDAPATRWSWACASKAYLWHVMRLATHYEGADAVLEPVLDHAQRLVPRVSALDGAISLLAARYRARQGRFAEASQLLRSGMTDLTIARVPSRAIEFIARDIDDRTTGPGWSVLEATQGLWRAAASPTKDVAASALASARLAAREDPILWARLETALRGLAGR